MVRPTSVDKTEAALILAGIPSHLWRVRSFETNTGELWILVSTREHSFRVDPKVGMVRAGAAAVDQVRRALAGHLPGSDGCPYCSRGGDHGRR